MENPLFLDALKRALALIAAGDAKVFDAAFVSVWVAGISTMIVSVLGIPLGFALAVGRFRGRGLLIALSNTLLALPTVVVGLLVYSLIRRGSPLGALDLLFSPAAMVAGQVVLALPIAVALGRAAIAAVDQAARETALVLGASPVRALFTLAWEARAGLLAVMAAVGGRLVGEVGISMMLGGNIQGYTRNLTTAIALETSKGEFAFALALGLILLVLALGLNLALRALRGREWELS